MLSVYSAGRGFEGVDEYAPVNTDNSQLAMNLPAACLAASPITVFGQGSAGADLEWSADQGSCLQTFPAAHDPRGRAAAEHFRVNTDVHEDGFLILRLRSYPAWDVRVNGKPVYENLPQRADGLIAVPVKQGHNFVTVDWTTTHDVWIGRWLSMLALALITTLCVVERKLAPPRLS
jgi:hypothetical protein